MVGINSNLSAASASRNLTSADGAVSSSISRLSSGNRIQKASDDVAGLAIGTSLRIGVGTLNVALLNTQQANSVLSIADGALSQIGDILARQKSLATQSNSGSLSDVQRGFLNQEFQALVSEIDRIVGATSFNGKTLLDGSASADASLTLSDPLDAGIIADADVSVSSTVTSYTAYGTYGSAVTSISSLGSFDDPTIDGAITFSYVTGSHIEGSGTGGETAIFQATVSLSDGSSRTYTSAVLTANTVADGNITAATTLVFTAANSSAFTLTLAAGAGVLNTSVTAATYATSLTTALADIDIQQTRDVTGLDNDNLTGTVLAGAAPETSGNVTIRAANIDTVNNDFGTIGEFTVVAGEGTGNYVTVTVNGKTFSASDIGGANDVLAAADTAITLIGRDDIGADTGERLVINISGIGSSTVDLTDDAAVADLADALNRLFNVGAAGSAYVSVGTAGNVADIYSLASFDDSAFQGPLGTIQLDEWSNNGGAAEFARLSVVLGDKTYTANLSSNGNGGTIDAQNLTFTATDDSGSAFSISLSGTNPDGSASTAEINSAELAQTFVDEINASLADLEIYQVRTVTSATSADVANTVLEGITDDAVTIKSNEIDTTASAFGDVGSFSGVAGEGAANSLTVVVNGITFTASDIGGANDTLSSADLSIVLEGRDAAGIDNNQRITIDISTLTRSIDLTNQDEVDALTSALNTYFGAGSSSGGLSFQIGARTTDTISVAIDAVETTDIYLNDDGVAQVLDISTADGAVTASAVLDNAINTITATRASLGASSSRFNFAAANLEISISNQDAARGTFLDTDTASESTAFASAQVKLQASIAVLAQANALPRNLLQLLQ